MDRIIAAIGAALRAIGRTVWVTCKKTGRLVMHLIPDFGAGAPLPAAAVQRRSNDNGARQVTAPTGAALAVKTLAQRMAAGTVTMQDMHNVPADTVKWMSQLDHIQLCKLICVEDLGGYMSGRREVRGLPAYLQMQERPSKSRTAEREMAHTPIAALAI
ncbi:hypothetical protein [Devosia salina]|uniref:Uncharacterized protein n=1 Tax=Devosia salina TaxID=2860336 RepID=A0ABX8W9R5_9HYPH|nr:hypothetical protein [Devosia salina]QYO75623.1 hypothetical protein K1X15_13385 [Devosia salina]